MKPTPTQSTPSLTVVMVTPKSYETCRLTLTYLRKQTACAEMELIIVAPSADEVCPDLAELDCFWGHQILPVGALISNGTSIAAGIRAANAPVVVYGEEHSYPTPDWAARLIARHCEPYAAVGYALGNANHQTKLKIELDRYAHISTQDRQTLQQSQGNPSLRIDAS